MPLTPKKIITAYAITTVTLSGLIAFQFSINAKLEDKLKARTKSLVYEHAILHNMMANNKPGLKEAAEEMLTGAMISYKRSYPDLAKEDSSEHYRYAQKVCGDLEFAKPTT